MSVPLQFMAQNGAMLSVGSSLLLAIGAIAVLIQRSPVHRQRCGELTILAVLTWLALAQLPLPRLPLNHWALSMAAGHTQHPSVQELKMEESTAATDSRDISVVTETQPAAGPTLPQRAPPPGITVERLEFETPTQTSVVPATVAVRTTFQHGHLLTAIFLAGAVACTSWLLLGRLLLWRMLGYAAHPDDWLLKLYMTLPCRRRPELLVSERASHAFSFGIVRPVIVLPARCCSAENASQLRAVLLHELAHAEQGDAWSRLVFNAAFPVLYFHPLYWLTRRWRV